MLDRFICLSATIVAGVLRLLGNYCKLKRRLIIMTEVFAKVRIPLPFPISNYITNSRSNLDSRQFAALCDYCAVEDLPD